MDNFISRASGAGLYDTTDKKLGCVATTSLRWASGKLRRVPVSGWISSGGVGPGRDQRVQAVDHAQTPDQRQRPVLPAGAGGVEQPAANQVASAWVAFA